MIQAAKLASAKRITAVMPLFPYARQDRKAKPREPISARLVADMLQLAGADRVLTMDLHAGQIQGFFTIPVDHMTALPLFARHFRDLGLTGPDIVSVAPDEGRAKMAVRFAEMIEAEFAIMHKTRPARDEVEVTEITGRVKDKIAIVGDDVIMTGGTLIANVAGAAREGRQGRLGVRDARRLLRRRAREVPRRADRRHRRHRHGADQPARDAAEHDGAARRAAARRDDHERLRRRLGLGDLRRREPALLSRPFLIDTDTASDDAVALLLALRNPGVDVRAITVVAGNVPLEQGVQNALYTCELAGAGVPVYAGAARPRVRELHTGQAVHGDDGMGDIGLPLHGRVPAEGAAAQVLVDEIRARPGRADARHARPADERRGRARARTGDRDAAPLARRHGRDVGSPRQHHRRRRVQRLGRPGSGRDRLRVGCAADDGRLGHLAHVRRDHTARMRRSCARSARSARSASTSSAR